MPRVADAPPPATSSDAYTERPLTTNLVAAEIHASEVDVHVAYGLRLSVDGNFAYAAETTSTLSAFHSLRAPGAPVTILEGGTYHADGGVNITALSPDGRFAVQSDGCRPAAEAAHGSLSGEKGFDRLNRLGYLKHLRWYDLRSPSLRWHDVMPWQHNIFPLVMNFLAHSQACWVEPG